MDLTDDYLTSKIYEFNFNIYKINIFSLPTPVVNVTDSGWDNNLGNLHVILWNSLITGQI